MGFNFAWCPVAETFSASHIRNDEDVFSFSVEHTEGDFAILTVEIMNPSEGVLKSTRRQWVWFSETDEFNVTVPLFRGKLVAVPENLDRDVVKVQFIARPDDFKVQKAALSASLKVHPYYDRVWIDESDDNDLDAVLEGYSRLWCIDRLTNTVTASDIIRGEDGHVLFTESDVFDETLSFSFKSAPINTVTCTATVKWSQAATGTVDITDAILAEFAAHGSPYGRVTSYTGDGLEKSWPTKDRDIGSGWKHGDVSLTLLSGDKVTATWSTAPIRASADDTSGVTACRFYVWEFALSHKVNYDVERDRSETITFTATADTQTFDTTAEVEPKVLSYSSERIASSIEPDGSMPIGTLSRRSYFGTDRGKKSLEYLLCIARANFLSSARCVEVSFEAPYEQIRDLTLRKDVVLQHSKIPSGEARGKIVGYSFSLDGNDGKMNAKVTFACTLGTGAAVPTDDADAEPSYADDYDDGYEAIYDETESPVAGEIAYDPPIITYGITGSGATCIDDGVDFSNMTQSTCLVSFVVDNGVSEQAPVATAGADSVDNAISALNKAKTFCRLTMVPLETGPFDNTYPVTTKPFAIPKTVDLGA